MLYNICFTITILYKNMEQQFFHGLSEPLYFFQTMNISLNYDFFTVQWCLLSN